jgi:hypothetical protein
MTKRGIAILIVTVLVVGFAAASSPCDSLLGAIS